MSMKRFSARFFKSVLYSRGAYDIPHSLLSRRSHAGPADVPALLSAEEPDKRLLSAIFPAEKGSVTNMFGFFESLVEAGNGYFGLNINSWNRTICARWFGFGDPCHRYDQKVDAYTNSLERPVRLLDNKLKICSLVLHHERSPNI